MKLTPPQTRALSALRKEPEGRLTSGGPHGIVRSTVAALARKGLVELDLRQERRTRHHRNGSSSTYITVTWTAYLVPEMPGADELAELDLIIANGEGSLRPTQIEQAAAYIANTSPAVALKGSPAASESYSVYRAYRDALKQPVSWLLDQVQMLRHLTGQCPLPGGIPAQSGPRTDVWVLTAKSSGERPGKELGRVRASTQTGAALLGNSLLNTRGGYQMRRLSADEVGRWISDFRASGLVLRLEEVDHGFRVSQVADDLTLVVRTTPEEARRDALADLTALHTLGSTTPPIHAD